MTTQDRIKLHIAAGEILELIGSAELTISIIEDDLPYFGKFFPDLVPSQRHRIEILKAAIERLEKRYQRVMGELR